MSVFDDLKREADTIRKAVESLRAGQVASPQLVSDLSRSAQKLQALVNEAESDYRREYRRARENG